MRLIKVWT